MPEIIMTGVGQFGQVLGAMLVRVERAGAEAARSAAELVKVKAAAKLAQRSHPPGTPTPSAPGEPPAWISGALAGSLRVSGPQPRGFGDYAVQVGPSVVYGRIQETGGATGRGHATVLPARPYLAPALAEAAPAVRDLFGAAFREAITL